MKDAITFIKHNLKYIIPTLILAMVILICLLNVEIYQTNQKVTTDNFDALNYQDYSGSLTISGESDGFKYEWFYSQSMLTDCQDTDLNLIFTSQYDDAIQSGLSSDYHCAYYFSESLKLNGYPTLTVYVPNVKPLTEFKLYAFDPIEGSFTQLSMAYNLTEDAYSITYAVSDTQCIYIITANEVLETTVTSKQITLDTTVTTFESDSTTLESLELTTTSTSQSTIQTTDTDTQTQVTTSTDNYTISSNENATSERELSDGSQVTQDDYLTDPVPIGKPLPVEPNDITITYDDYYTCYLTIKCDTILDNMDNLTFGKEIYVPSDGIIYNTQEVIFYEGESVYDVLYRETEKNGIQMESSFTPVYNSVYIEGINNLYEFDCGSLSGWVYSVNDWFPNYGCSRYMLAQGDNIVFYYTCSLGQDVGCVVSEVS
ncbi:MAG: DUF4430 domain-containing protein [Ruminococcus sp.]|nr:DUF4430 domain-containing protein [Ruminococcus sp.]